MMKLKLVKGLSYTSPSFSCKKGKAVDVSDEVGAKLMKTGRFEIAADEVAEETTGASGDGSNNDGEGQELTAEVIEKMKKDELVALAEAKGIDISDCNNNDERAEKIKGALGLVNMATLFGE